MPNQQPVGDHAPVSSRWMWLGVVLPIGFGCWVPAAAGFKAQNRAWIGWGAFVVLFALVAFVVATAEGDEDRFGGALLIFSWILHGATSFALMRPYRQRMSARARYDTRIAQAEHIDEERRTVVALARTDPQRALALGVGRPDLPGTRHGYVVDVNHAPVDVVATLPAVDAEVAARIARMRDELGGFDSIDDLGHLLDLHPDVVAMLRWRAVAL